VWFDSGSTHRAIQVSHPELRPAWEEARRGKADVLYFEGPDQHRGWFNSSLMVGVGAENAAPYTAVATHGWVLDASGRAMHKSLGNVVSPLTLIEKYGADVVRWWALATDWRGDVRVGDEILQRVADAYRKVRNTLRFLLGNLADYTPADAVPEARLLKTDRAFADHLTARGRGEDTTATDRTPCAATRRWANAGLASAAVPTATRVAPAARIVATEASSRRPPAASTWISSPTLARIAAIVAPCTGPPERAPSRSTTWSHRIPAALNALATATGSSENAVSRSKSPCSRRTTRPPRRSIAARISNPLADRMVPCYLSSTLLCYNAARTRHDGGRLANP